VRFFNTGISVSRLPERWFLNSQAGGTLPLEYSHPSVLYIHIETMQNFDTNVTLIDFAAQTTNVQITSHDIDEIPLLELFCSAGVDTMAHGDNRRQGLELILIGFPIIRSWCKFCTN
jgi:hypothetical protein